MFEFHNSSILYRAGVAWSNNTNSCRQPSHSVWTGIRGNPPIGNHYQTEFPTNLSPALVRNGLAMRTTRARQTNFISHKNPAIQTAPQNVRPPPDLGIAGPKVVLSIMVAHFIGNTAMTKDSCSVSWPHKMEAIHWADLLKLYLNFILVFCNK